MKNDITTLLVINHTHWDREWYRIQSDYGFQLVQKLHLILDTLNSGQYQNFLFDGQTIILEDLKQTASPTDYESLCKYIREGRVEVGPWYILPDTFLVGGESHIRNLELGHRLAEEAGNNSCFGYLPDSFGHISQIPQLLRGFGYRSALIYRGSDSPDFVARWTGPDGSEVTTVVLPNGYYHEWLSRDDYIQEWQRFASEFSSAVIAGHALLLNGADHRIPPPDSTTRFQEIEKQDKNLSVQQITLSELDTQLHSPNLAEHISARITGEQHTTGKDNILPGVFSTRMYLKVRNAFCDALLTGILEPISAMGDPQGIYHNYVQYLWRLFMQNHPHDSVCGCSIDEVHREMETRFTSIEHGGHRMVSNLLRQAAGFQPVVFKPYVLIYNPSPYPNEQSYAEIELWVPKDEDTGSIRLRAVPSEVLMRDSFHDPISEGNVIRYRLGIIYPSEGLGLYEFEIERVGGDATQQTQLIPSQHISNEYISINVEHDGACTVTDLQDGHSYTGMLGILHSLDAGDEYNWSPPAHDILSHSILRDRPTSVRGNLSSRLYIPLRLTAPSGLAADRERPSDERICLDIDMQIELRRHDPLAHITITMNNRFSDCRLRLLFPLGTTASATWSDTAFDYIKREVHRDLPAGRSIRETPVNTEATLSACSVHSNEDDRGLSVVHNGLCEYAVDRYDNDRDALYLTLLRAVGWLSREDFITRAGNAGPPMATPEAQCHRQLRMELGFGFFPMVEALSRARDFRIRPVVVQGLREKALFQQASSQHEFDFRLVLDNRMALISGLRRLTPSVIELRLFNPYAEKIAIKIQLTTPSDIVRSDFLGREQEQLAHNVHEKSISIAAKHIITLQLRKSSSGHP